MILFFFCSFVRLFVHFVCTHSHFITKIVYSFYPPSKLMLLLVATAASPCSILLCFLQNIHTNRKSIIIFFLFLLLLSMFVLSKLYTLHNPTKNNVFVLLDGDYIVLKCTYNSKMKIHVGKAASSEQHSR